MMHHNVIWNCGKGLMLKGYNHRVHHNTAFDNTNGMGSGKGNDILVMIAQGGNAGTQTTNNAANRISGHRTGTYADYPVPGTYNSNWNGYVEGGDVKALLVDPTGALTGTRDFRPKPGSALIDAGQVIAGVSDTYVGAAPDIGAYEYGATPWVPGVTWDVSARNVTFVPPERDVPPPPPPLTPSPLPPPISSSSPPPSPSPGLPPPAPGVAIFAVTSTFALGGEVADYDEAAQTSIKTVLAAGANVSSSAVSLSLAGGSVVVSAQIFVASQAEADAAAASLLAGPLASAAALEAALKKQFANDDVATAVKVEELTQAPRVTTGVGAGASTGAIAGGAAGGGLGAIALCIACAWLLMRRRAAAKVAAAEVKAVKPET